MTIQKKNVYKYLSIFLLIHLIIWTLIPSLANNNLPLDTIEALGWSDKLQLGYDKYPPVFPVFIEFFYFLFGGKDWAYYLLSQLFVISSFYIIFKLSNYFFRNQIYSLLSILLLEGIYFYNFTTPELNAFLCQFPFLAATALYAWKSVKFNDNASWILFGIFSGLAALTYYLSLYLLASLGLFFIYTILETKKLNHKYFLALISFIIILLPHLIWIIENDYSSIRYAFFRSFDDPLSDLSGYAFLDRLFYPLIFLGKQIGLLIPVFIMIFFIIKKIKIKINYKDEKLIFLFFITVAPIILMFLTSLIMGTRIRTMWMTSFYLFTGLFLIYLYQLKIKLSDLTNFFRVFLFLFILSPVLYYFVAITKNDKRTSYPGKKISQIVQKEWDKNFSSKIEVVFGDGWINGGWYAGNLSYHLKSRPKRAVEIDDDPEIGTIIIKGFNEIKKCNGVVYQIEPFNDICMFGEK